MDMKNPLDDLYTRLLFMPEQISFHIVDKGNLICRKTTGKKEKNPDQWNFKLNGSDPECGFPDVQVRHRTKGRLLSRMKNDETVSLRRPSTVGGDFRQEAGFLNSLVFRVA